MCKRKDGLIPMNDNAHAQVILRYLPQLNTSAATPNYQHDSRQMSVPGHQ